LGYSVRCGRSHLAQTGSPEGFHLRVAALAR
ncbi:hypothetical protein A2U01_0113048, partial [Trifolium medium]|nr:hypothetical protein [Trifolium medium]